MFTPRRRNPSELREEGKRKIKILNPLLRLIVRFGRIALHYIELNRRGAACATSISRLTKSSERILIVLSISNTKAKAKPLSLVSMRHTAVIGTVPRAV